MKKLVVTSILAGALAGSAFGQGTVVFNNDSATRVTYTAAAKAALGTLVGATDVGPKGGTLWQAELYYATDAAGSGGLLGGLMTPSARTGFGTLGSGGTFSGGTRSTPTTTAPGGAAWFQVRVWELAFGASYEEALAAAARPVGGVTRQAIVGSSNPFRMVTGDAADTSPEPPLFANGLAAFTVDIVPEPSTYALGLLGLAGMFMLRRRNKNA